MSLSDLPFISSTVSSGMDPEEKDIKNEVKSNFLWFTCAQINPFSQTEHTIFMIMLNLALGTVYSWHCSKRQQWLLSVKQIQIQSTSQPFSAHGISTVQLTEWVCCLFQLLMYMYLCFFSLWSSCISHSSALRLSLPHQEKNMGRENSKID